jgi:hypothetical protein
MVSERSKIEIRFAVYNVLDVLVDTVKGKTKILYSLLKHLLLIRTYTYLNDVRLNPGDCSIDRKERGGKKNIEVSGTLPSLSSMIAINNANQWQRVSLK